MQKGQAEVCWVWVCAVLAGKETRYNQNSPALTGAAQQGVGAVPVSPPRNAVCQLKYHMLLFWLFYTFSILL